MPVYITPNHEVICHVTARAVRCDTADVVTMTITPKGFPYGPEVRTPARIPKLMIRGPLNRRITYGPFNIFIHRHSIDVASTITGYGFTAGDTITSSNVWSQD